jgi:hypothetical protein
MDVSPSWSVLLEWAPYISGYKSLIEQEYNPFTFGIELETGVTFLRYSYQIQNLLTIPNIWQVPILLPVNGTGDWDL